VLFLLFCLPDVFLPTIIGRDKSDAGLIFVVNLLLAGPLLVWDRGGSFGRAQPTTGQFPYGWCPWAARGISAASAVR